MMEIRIHGRGGQGNVVAAYILAQAAFEHGKFAQAFPSFGPERRGAPVTAFVRIADVPFRRHCAVLHPAVLILQDHALLHSPGTTEGLRPQGAILVNWSGPAESISGSSGQMVMTIPAARMANDFLGKPVPNTVLLAALITLTGLIPLTALERALALRFHGEMLERNVRLVREAANAVPADLWRDVISA
ncbi:MAG: 2-oxoacid:acceptor oxidoreductase family protein [Candidatus Binataceae bacterium]